jgi:hypothetical protein
MVNIHPLLIMFVGHSKATGGFFAIRAREIYEMKTGKNEFLTIKKLETACVVNLLRRTPVSENGKRRFCYTCRGQQRRTRNRVFEVNFRIRNSMPNLSTL